MKKVQILISTYNGERYLKEQIESLQNQVGVKIDILVRDDGSSDSTKQMLQKWQDEGVLKWYQGENLKPAKSFLNLMENASRADYYAFSDQDDVWDEDKLVRAIERLEICKKNVPTLYFSETQLVDKDLLPIMCNGGYKKKVTFGCALIKNSATGCTMVFNKELLNVVNQYKPDVIPMHDHWIYLLCLAIGGIVLYDINSHIKYRQHGNNAVGAKKSIKKECRNKFRIFVAQERAKQKVSLELAKGYYELIPEENKRMLKKVLKYRNSLSDKIKLILDPKIKTDSLKENVEFIIAVIFNVF